MAPGAGTDRSRGERARHVIVYRFPPAQMMDSLSQAPPPTVLVIVYTRLRMRRARPILLRERDRLAAVG
jgi:hypothetical protein